jgi:hypothetical protein
LASAVVEILVFFGFRSLFVLVSTFCFGWCFDSVRPPFVFFALVFVLVVLVVVDFEFFSSPFSLVGVCVYEALLMFSARFFLWLTAVVKCRVLFVFGCRLISDQGVGVPCTWRKE